MATGRHSRDTSSVSNPSISSLMQDVPGAISSGPLPSMSSGGDSDTAGDDAPYQSLSAAIRARRADYVRPKHIRIKIGTWNVASCKGTEKDVGAWFVEGKGLGDTMVSPKATDASKGGPSGQDDQNGVEQVAAQEERYKRKKETLPIGDTGSLPGNEEVGLYALCLQEVVDVNSASEALRPYTDPSVAKKWKVEMQEALPAGYQLVAEQQLIGLLLLIYASPEVASEVKSVSTTSVGTGLMGYMGNKGAVTARLVLGETTRLVFINSHLAAGADKASLERRNWDASQIVSRTRFEPIKDAMDLSQTNGEQIGDEDFTFWTGDLNYRLEGIPGEDVRRLLMLHTRNKFDVSSRSAQKIKKELENADEEVERRVEERTSISSSKPSSLHMPPPPDRDVDQEAVKSQHSDDETDEESDPASLQTTLSSLLPHDELHQQMRSRKAFYDGWQEGEIKFLPTYKYDVGCVGVFDSSEKRRAPSWCDRILYRTRRARLAYEAKVQEEENVRRRDEELRSNGVAEAAEDENVLYDYDPESDGADARNDGTLDYDDDQSYDDAKDGVVITNEGFRDEIELEHYTAHQRVLSSDHKPLDAIFLLKYDAVVPDLKAQVLAEVAREMDKRENEERPSVTVVIDKHRANDVETTDENPESFPGVWLGDVRWGEGKHRSLTVANTGRVSANFKFIERPVGAGQATGIAPKWVNVKVNEEATASSGNESALIKLEPGDTCSVELSVRIFDMETVRHLNEGVKQLDDVLVLRVENGRDHFIPIRGNWQDSSLGQSIGRLCRVPEGGIRRLQGQKPQGNKNLISSEASSSTSLNLTTSTSPKMPRSPESTVEEDEQPVRSSAPRELFRLTEAIEEMSTRVVAEWEMMNAPLSSPSSLSDTEVVKPPWELYPAWPFDEQAWRAEEEKVNTIIWEDALSDACDALDCDRSLENAFPFDMPRVIRLYILSELLLTFLQGITEGIVTAETWKQIEHYLASTAETSRRDSQHATPDAKKIAIQELILQQSTSAHSISFLLVTTFLLRLQSEVVVPSALATSTPEQQMQDISLASPPTSPSSKRSGSGVGSLKRLTGFVGKTASNATKVIANEEQKRDNARTVMGKVFADAIIRAEIPGNEKAKAALKKRKVDVLETFMKKDGLG